MQCKGRFVLMEILISLGTGALVEVWMKLQTLSEWVAGSEAQEICVLADSMAIRLDLLLQQVSSRTAPRKMKRSPASRKVVKVTVSMAWVAVSSDEAQAAVSSDEAEAAVEDLELVVLETSDEAQAAPEGLTEADLE
jgi:hypothetical protein